MENTAVENKGSSKWIIWWIVIFVIVVIIGSFFGKYNTLVSMEEGVKTAWAQVENQYQRRSDLIPNIVNTVKGEANFEKSTLTDVINARASATKTNINVNDATALAEYQKQQTWISSALSRLMMVTENYPTLQSNKWFSDLRIRQEFNTTIRQFPTNIIASMFSFQNKNLFEADTKAQEAPKVDFQ